MKKILSLCIALLLFGAACPVSASMTEVFYAPPEEWYSEASSEASLLSAGQEAARAAITAALQNVQTEVSVAEYGLTIAEARSLLISISNEDPSLFYVGMPAGNAQGYPEGAIVCSILHTSNIATKITGIPYMYDKATILEKKEKINKEVQRIRAAAQSTMTDVEKALAVHDKMALSYRYDYESLALSPVPRKAHTIEGLFIDKAAVCDGYAKAYKLILSSLGIPAIVVGSDAMNHAWNMIYVNSAWYHVDVTWDDPSYNQKDIFGNVSHNYFLKSDTEFENGPDPAEERDNHFGWDSVAPAAPAAYPKPFWQTAHSGMFWQDGAWYFAEVNHSTNTVSIFKREGDTLSTCLSLTGTDVRFPIGVPGYFTYATCIALHRDRLYYTTPHAIYSMKTDGTDIRQVLSAPTGQSIFGITIFEDTLMYSTAPYYAAEAVFRSITLADIAAALSGDKIEVTILNDAIFAGQLMVAQYDEGGTLLSLREAAVSETRSYQIPLPTGEIAKETKTIRVFLWNTSLRPIAEPYTLIKK